MNSLPQTAGWIGTFLVVLAYFLVSTKRVKPYSKRYQMLNLLGAIGVGFSVFTQGAWPALALQIVWGMIALISIFKSKK